VLFTIPRYFERSYAYVSESVEHPRKYFRNNVEAALTLLNATSPPELALLFFFGLRRLRCTVKDPNH
jgi:hypothetical protein